MLYYKSLKRCVAQLGRALRSGRRGRRFKSCRFDLKNPLKSILSGDFPFCASGLFSPVLRFVLRNFLRTRSHNLHFMGYFLRRHVNCIPLNVGIPLFGRGRVRMAHPASHDADMTDGFGYTPLFSALINTCLAVKSYLNNKKDNHPRQRQRLSF